MAGWGTKERSSVRTTVALIFCLRMTLTPWGGPSERKAHWHELFSKLDLHVVYTHGPVSLVGYFMFHLAFPANPAFGDVSLHGTVQAYLDVRDMLAALFPSN